MLSLKMAECAGEQVVDAGEPNYLPKLKILWLFRPDYGYGMEHGGHLRVFNWTSQLISQGHEVYFAVMRDRAGDPIERMKYLAGLREQKIITDYFEVEYQHPRWRGKLARLSIHPKLVNYLLRQAQSSAKIAVQNFIASKQIDVCIFMDRNLLFVLPDIKDSVRTVVDWVDCYVLYQLRQLPIHLKRRQLTEGLTALRQLYVALVEERYYGRCSTANALTSPADKKYIDWINKAPSKNHVLLNGVKKQAAGAPVEKIKNRIIFTGNMDFPPNYESAIWFIDHVFPQLQQRLSDVRLVIAGANPVKELAARAGEQIEITGYVEDMRHEIAKSALYVAPLICGGGFKNKVVEALTSGTFVVGTEMAVEFLNPNVRKHLLVGDTPEELIEAILAYFENPQKFDHRLEMLKRVVEEEFSWETSTKELLQLIYSLPQIANDSTRSGALTPTPQNEFSGQQGAGV